MYKRRYSSYEGFFYFLTLSLESSEDHLNCNVHLGYPVFFLKKADVYDGYGSDTMAYEH